MQLYNIIKWFSVSRWTWPSKSQWWTSFNKKACYSHQNRHRRHNNSYNTFDETLV